MSRLTDLIAQVKAKDSQLGIDLEREFKALSSRRAFGLNFERHQPEAVELPGRPLRKGDKVRVLPKRGSTKRGDQRLWLVKKTHKVDGQGLAQLELLDASEPETQEVAIDDLVVVAEFRDHIYPGLVSTGKVEQGGDKPYHTVINGENYHVLQALTYTHRGKIDAIYIDPPYNGGAKDWKYNNDYVEKEDLYRHSKWLAFMERRFKIARQLLNPHDSVLVVTIDEKEYLRLGLLLDQTFPEATIQMITSSIKPSGSQRTGEFSRVEEYLFFVLFGTSAPASHYLDMLRDTAESIEATPSVTWHGLRRRGSTDWKRSHRPNGFYPIHIDPDTEKLVSVGEPIHINADRHEYQPPEGTIAIWPLDPQGNEGRWQISPTRLREQLKNGTAALSSVNREIGTASIVYLKQGDLNRIEYGEVKVVGRNNDGRVIVESRLGASRRPKTMWVMDSHDASAYGTALLGKFLEDRKFPFPKSLYAVEDSLRFFIKGKPNAIVLDFFAGSGTTAHAVMRLNHQDGGHRQCILVTNNEVAADEQTELRKQGFRPGDPDWEQWGICDYITKPRIKSTITGLTPDGEPIEGDYKFTDEFPMAQGFEENAEFFTLTYETPVSVNHNQAFQRIAPLLWMRAGSRGCQINTLPDKGWEVVDAYGLLTDLDQASPFCVAIEKANELQIAFIVTDDDRRFQSVAQRLPEVVEPIRLYESYLSNFRFVNGE